MQVQMHRAMTVSTLTHTLQLFYSPVILYMDVSYVYYVLLYSLKIQDSTAIGLHIDSLLVGVSCPNEQPK